MNPETLATIRKRWGLTQADMAELMAVSGALIVSQWENGYRNPSGIVNKLYKLLDELPPADAKALLKWLRSVKLDECERRKIGRRSVRGKKP